jgi:hypothetical protein
LQQLTELLGKPVTAPQVQRALSRLADENWILRGETGRWVVASDERDDWLRWKHVLRAAEQAESLAGEPALTAGALVQARSRLRRAIFDAVEQNDLRAERPDLGLAIELARSTVERAVLRLKRESYLPPETTPRDFVAAVGGRHVGEADSAPNLALLALDLDEVDSMLRQRAPRQSLADQSPGAKLAARVRQAQAARADEPECTPAMRT